MQHRAMGRWFVNSVILAALVVLAPAVVGTAVPSALPGDDGIVYPDEADFNGDTASDTLVLLPLGDPEGGEGGIAGDCAIGEVHIHSGTTGQVITRFVASTCDDHFGAAISIVRDLNGDGQCAGTNR